MREVPSRCSSRTFGLAAELLADFSVGNEQIKNATPKPFYMYRAIKG